MSEIKTSYEFKVIGHVESCFKQKFGIPRQPGLVKNATAKLRLLPEFSHPDIVRGLEQYSHIWVLFVFHETDRENFKNTVRPPRLGGNERMGVFATRSNFRPNPIGQSVVKLESVDSSTKQIVLYLSGIDILDGTPVLDIKPYIAYADCRSNAKSGFAKEAPIAKYNVKFSGQVMKVLDSNVNVGENLKELITEMLSFDHLPTYYDDVKCNKDFYSKICHYDMCWKIIDANTVYVESIVKSDIYS